MLHILIHIHIIIYLQFLKKRIQLSDENNKKKSQKLHKTEEYIIH